jgi:hypothetical protein
MAVRREYELKSMESLGELLFCVLNTKTHSYFFEPITKNDLIYQRTNAVKKEVEAATGDFSLSAAERELKVARVVCLFAGVCVFVFLSLAQLTDVLESSCTFLVRTDASENTTRRTGEARSPRTSKRLRVRLLSNVERTHGRLTCNCCSDYATNDMVCV